MGTIRKASGRANNSRANGKVRSQVGRVGWVAIRMHVERRNVYAANSNPLLAHHTNGILPASAIETSPPQVEFVRALADL